MDCEAAKRMEDFAKEILRQTPAMQKKMWEALEPVLTADETREFLNRSKNLLENSFTTNFTICRRQYKYPM